VNWRGWVLIVLVLLLIAFVMFEGGWFRLAA
jgi:hypothetical protein